MKTPPIARASLLLLAAVAGVAGVAATPAQAITQTAAASGLRETPPAVVVTGSNTGLNNTGLGNTGLGSTGLSAPGLQSVVASAVPEPATWLMLVIGFGLIGLSTRRRAAPARVLA
jgi:hypothetical protein